jgi:hypothetical protein
MHACIQVTRSMAEAVNAQAAAARLHRPRHSSSASNPCKAAVTHSTSPRATTSEEQREGMTPPPPAKRPRTTPPAEAPRFPVSQGQGPPRSPAPVHSFEAGTPGRGMNATAPLPAAPGSLPEAFAPVHFNLAATPAGNGLFATTLPPANVGSPPRAAAPLHLFGYAATPAGRDATGAAASAFTLGTPPITQPLSGLADGHQPEAQPVYARSNAAPGSRHKQPVPAWSPAHQASLASTALAALHVWRECGAHAAHILAGASDLRTNSLRTELMESVLSLLWAPMPPLALLASLSSTGAGTGAAARGIASDRGGDVRPGLSPEAAPGTASAGGAGGACAGGVRMGIAPEVAELIQGVGTSWTSLLTGLTDGVLTR